jgi:hypothetical protein
MMDNFNHIHGIHPAPIAVDRRSNQHQFKHIIWLVVSTSLPCYDFELGFTNPLGFLFLEHKTTKVTMNKVSIQKQDGIIQMPMNIMLFFRRQEQQGCEQHVI